jgi:hypothetical protein
MMLNPMQEEMFEIPYAMRMLAVAYFPGYIPASAEQESQIAETLSDYVRQNHAIWYLPLDKKQTAVDDMIRKYFSVKKTVAYPFNAYEYRTYYQLIPRQTTHERPFQVPRGITSDPCTVLSAWCRSPGSNRDGVASTGF